MLCRLNKRKRINKRRITAKKPINTGKNRKMPLTLRKTSLSRIVEMCKMQIPLGVYIKDGYRLTKPPKYPQKQKGVISMLVKFITTILIIFFMSVIIFFMNGITGSEKENKATVVGFTMMQITYILSLISIWFF